MSGLHSSGRPNGVPVSYAEGNKRNRQMALLQLQESLINNTATNIFERVLADKYPEHRTLQGADCDGAVIAFAFVLFQICRRQITFSRMGEIGQTAIQFGY